MHPKYAEGIANSVDPDQTGSALFAQTCLSENLGNYGSFVICMFYSVIWLHSNTDIYQVLYNSELEQMPIAFLWKIFK